MMNYRKENWIKGKPSDVKAGDYVVAHRAVRDNCSSFIADIFDYVVGGLNSIGWAMGLKNNVSMNIGRTHVLVMDNHNFAMPFIMEMFDRGILRKGSAMLHFDEHDDLFANREFNARDYASLKSEQEKFRYIVEHTTISDWQVPLIRSGKVREKDWKWCVLDSETFKWAQQEPSDPKDRRIEMASGLKKLSTKLGKDIVDIDIDVLRVLDQSLSEKEKEEVLAGKLPVSIDLKLRYLAYIASHAKVVTIALSPCFINQGRGLVYVQRLLKYMEGWKGAHFFLPPSRRKNMAIRTATPLVT